MPRSTQSKKGLRLRKLELIHDRRKSQNPSSSCTDDDDSENLTVDESKSIIYESHRRQELTPASAPMLRQSPAYSRTCFKSKPLSPKLSPDLDLNLALWLDKYGNGTMSLNAANGSFAGYNEGPTSNGGMSSASGGGMQRQAPSPMGQQQQQQGVNNGVNGVNGGMNGMGVSMPVNAGQQMDVNMVYQKLMELSEVLRDNRERTQGIVAGAEELAVCMVDDAAMTSLCSQKLWTSPSCAEVVIC